MIPCKYTGLDGSIRVLDLDTVVDVVKGASLRKAGWKALIVYDEITNALVELRDSPEDYRGNSQDEAEQVTEQYACDAFHMDTRQFGDLYRSPRNWNLIDELL